MKINKHNWPKLYWSDTRSCRLCGGVLVVNIMVVSNMISNYRCPDILTGRSGSQQQFRALLSHTTHVSLSAARCWRSWRGLALQGMRAQFNIAVVNTEHNCSASHPLIDHANFQSELRPWQRALVMRLFSGIPTVPREPASRRIRRSWDEVDLTQIRGLA